MLIQQSKVSMKCIVKNMNSLTERSIICFPSFPCMKISNGSFLDVSTVEVPAGMGSCGSHGLTCTGCVGGVGGIGGIGGVGGVYLETF